MPEHLMLYSGKHTFGTKLLEVLGTCRSSCEQWGHSSVQTPTIYQHPNLEIIRTVMDGDKEEAVHVTAMQREGKNGF